MREQKILKIIEEQGHFTVKSDNKTLFKTIKEMETKKLIEFKDRRGKYYYYGNPDGKEWKLNTDDGPHAGAYWTDRYW